MSFNFSNIKANLEGINKYLESNGIKLSTDETKQLESIFTQADKSVYAEGSKKYNDGELDAMEQMNFKLPSKLAKIGNKIKEFFKGVNDSSLDKTAKRNSEAKTDAISNGNVRNQPKVIRKNVNLNLTKLAKTEDLIRNELNDKKIKLSDEDIKYWTNLVDKVASKYNSSPELLITIISKECGFQKHTSNGGGAGPMGITTTSIEDFLPKTKTGKPNIRAKLYKDMHPELVNDILKYSTSASVLRSKAGKNDELGMLLGLLTYEMKYCNEVAAKFNTSISKAIEKVKNGDRLDKKTDEKYIKNSLKNYNGSKNKEKYSRTTLDSLKRLTNNDFRDLIFIEKDK